MRTRFIQAGMAALLAFSIAACGGAETEEPVDAAPEAPEGISVSDGRMNLPAVAGNPAALYFTMDNASNQRASIRSAYVDGAESTVLHETGEWSLQEDMQEVELFVVDPGQTLVLEPGGSHVMAMGVDESLQPGGETEVTLTFAGGDKVSFPVRLLAPGDDGSGDGE